MAKEKSKTKKKGKKNIKQSGVVNYPVGDFLIRVKNACLADKRQVTVSKTNLIKSVAKVMKDLGYLEKVEEDGRKLTVSITYHSKKPILTDIKLVSRPGLRIYKSVRDLEGHKGPSTPIVSTSKGVMSSKDAVKKRLGGEVIAEIL
jgi:small subunit ribosomal protein S8